jgi:hypothetical protein
MEPLDAITAEKMDKHWLAANRYAASEVMKLGFDIRESSAVSYYLAKEGRRIRNEYLAKAG